MGFARRRVGKDGKTRYTATHVDLRGSIRSAGTFASEKAANKAWQNAEAELRQGRVGDPARGRQTFRKYVAERCRSRSRPARCRRGTSHAVAQSHRESVEAESASH
jgi:hypothetical protein